MIVLKDGERMNIRCQDRSLMDLLANCLSCLPAACTPFLPPLPTSYTVAVGYWDARARCGEVYWEEGRVRETERERGSTGPRWPA